MTVIGVRLRGQIPERKNSYSASCTYYANGNRLTRTVNSVTENYVVDDADKLLEVKVNNLPIKEYDYDAAGRTIEVVTSSGATTLAYDFEGRISTITYPNLSTNTFAYNGLDTRVSKVDSSGTRTYMRDGVYVTDPVLSDGAANYTPGTSERRGTDSTFNHSGLKNTQAQTDELETVSATRQYDAFGNVTNSTGAWQGPFGYAGGFGYQEDPDSGLKLLGHRYYDSSTGRFLTRDPIKDGRNWYGYCSNNPLARQDRYGLKWTITFTIGKGGGVSVGYEGGKGAPKGSITIPWDVFFGGGTKEDPPKGDPPKGDQPTAGPPVTVYPPGGGSIPVLPGETVVVPGDSSIKGEPGSYEEEVLPDGRRRITVPKAESPGKEE